MVAPLQQTERTVRPGMSNSVERYTGKVVYIYAFDVAYDMARLPEGDLLGHSLEQFSVDAGKRCPRQFFFCRPQMVRLPALERAGPHGPVRLERVIKLLPVGALSITVSVQFARCAHFGPGRLSRFAIHQWRLVARGNPASS